MSAVDVTPSAVPSRRSTGLTSSTGKFKIRRYPRPEMRATRYRFHEVPPKLLMTLELGLEDDSAWAHIPELDVSGEGSDVNEAIHAVLTAAREWLSYLRDEQPELAPALEAQRRYVALLDFPGYGWFNAYNLG